MQNVLQDNLHIVDSMDSTPLQLAQILQYHILSQAKAYELKALKEYFLRLNAAELLTNTICKNLIDLFEQNAFLAKQSKAKQSLNIPALYEELHTISHQLAEFISPEAKQSLQTILHNARTQKFSIGVTGVLSAGKSTFLNALLGREILGTSTIPETANLTILKYAPNEYAKIYFWSKQEWRDLQEASRFNPNLQDFIDETEHVFGTQLESLLDSSKQIQPNELKTYTSANDASKLCNLVKKVELYTSLKFLQNNVEIVDTPGLDDPITKREEITKSYISECDLLIHVMNASCAATQVDIDFILESLLTQNISRLLVILTRADLLTSSDLTQSLTYTKSSLANQLKKLQFQGNIDALIERIDFVPLAGFYALCHKIGNAQIALDKGFSLEQTGILQIESYLDSMLLGENSLKQKDILYNSYQHYDKIIQSELAYQELESTILNASQEEIQALITQIKQHNQALLQDFETTKTLTQEKLCELQTYLDSMQKIIASAKAANAKRLKTQLYDDIVYEYAKGSKPSNERIQSMIQINLEDIFSDINREFAYKTSKKITQLCEEIHLDSDTKIPHIHLPNIKPQIQYIIDSLAKECQRLIASHSKSSQEKLSQSLEIALDSAFTSFGEILARQTSEIQMLCMKFFEDSIALKHKHIQENIHQSQQRLDSALQQTQKHNTKELKEKSLHIQKQLKEIQNEVKIVIEALV